MRPGESPHTGQLDATGACTILAAKPDARFIEVRPVAKIGFAAGSDVTKFGWLRFGADQSRVSNMSKCPRSGAIELELRGDEGPGDVLVLPYTA